MTNRIDFSESESIGETPMATRETRVLPGIARSSQRDDPTNEKCQSEEWQLAQERANICEEFLALMADPSFSLNTAAAALGKSPSWFSGNNSMLARYRRGGVAALVERPRIAPVCGDLSKAIEGLGWFVPAANFFYLITNRTFERGSVPEAVRRVLSLPKVPKGWKESDKRKLISRLMKAGGFELVSEADGEESVGHRSAMTLPSCPPELREACLAREKAGQQLVPQRVARQITVSPGTVRQYRNPREAALDYLSSPGGMRLVTDYEVEGEKRLARAGEIIEADDATVNFAVCVPWSRDGGDDPCVRKYGVKVARFQWLVSIDVGTSFVTGFSYTARPRSSYRAEDIVSLMRMVCRQHGIPRTWRFERGSWESNLVKNAVKNMGSRLYTVYSPHQKPFIEGLFNVLWTKLSVNFPGGHVGRFMGEEREANLLLGACQRGEKDPRRYFPMLATAIAAFQEVIAEKNRTPVNTACHGRWVPEERWENERAEHLRVMDPAADWMFAPFIRDWTVKGMLVGGRVPMFESLSVPFDFSAPWLPQYSGARVRCHFDPADPKCVAKLVLLENCNHVKAGTVIGDAAQVNSAAAYVRLVMGFGDDPASAGLKARQQAAAAMRREVRAVVPKSHRGDAEAQSEERDGLGTVTKVEVGSKKVEKEERSSQDLAVGQDDPTPEESADRAKKADEFFERNALDFV